ncbi:hypothetical protein CAEBREN_05142 [Caenorhabditis brenneri]|uniref:F-box domain-containing protein n=1 Tax=Caenorhabditis brenneri TaxID=135651 RepID=G0NEN6_CAEBE|nr:hypothetical protein CAEBREN_05142 [Caenorhabditis brenneri]
MVENRTFQNPRNQARARRYSFLEKMRIARSKRTRRSCSYSSRLSETEASQVDAWFQSFLTVCTEIVNLYMSWLLGSGIFIPSAIYTLYTGGHSRDDAVAHLLRSHEFAPEHFPRVDYRDVDFWYNSFRNKNFDLEQKPEYPNDLTRLENLPVLDKVLSNVGSEDQQKLRLVCHKFKHFIDSERKLIKTIRIQLNSDSVNLLIECGITQDIICTAYKRSEAGCEIIRDGETVTSKNNFIDAAMEDFKSANQRTDTKITSLLIISSKGDPNDEDRTMFFSKIGQTLSEVKEKVYVESLLMKDENVDELEIILTGIKPGRLSAVFMQTRSTDETDLTRIVDKNQHWQYLKQFHASSQIDDLKLDTIAHMDTVRISTTSEYSAQELLDYKIVNMNPSELFKQF